MRRVRQSVIGEGEAFHRTSPDGDRGEKLPAFATKLADGTSFTDKNLEGGQTSALVFFRGHW